MNSVVTRIAPSPTGYMHIGTARTALFNWLFARSKKGKFLLRIEDTDEARSKRDTVKTIFESLEWLGLDYDGQAVTQQSRSDRHVEIAKFLLKTNKAYKCFSTQDEIENYRQRAKKQGKSTMFKSPWRNSNPSDHPTLPFCIRIKSPENGQTTIYDKVQGTIQINNDELDDMILLRSTGTPVYMLAVVVDDNDMGVTHIIRGDDHLTNSARQMMIYDAMNWPKPIYAHLPLILDQDGKKLSKRKGALGIEDYRSQGYPASAIRNYLARLGWSHKDDEYFTDTQALEWFSLDNIGKSPSKLDDKKLQNLSRKHITNTEDQKLVREIEAFSRHNKLKSLSEQEVKLLSSAMYCLKTRAKNYKEIIEMAQFIFVQRPIEVEEKFNSQIKDKSVAILKLLTPKLENVSWNRDELESLGKAISETNDLAFGQLATVLRAALVGKAVTPSVFDMMHVLGREETIARITEFFRNN